MVAAIPTRSGSSAEIAEDGIENEHPLAFDVLWINGGLLVRPRARHQSCDSGFEPLTPREHEVLALVAEGNSNKSVADQLGITERTVKSHLTCIMSKMHASDRTHAVVLAIRRGWLAV